MHLHLNSGAIWYNYLLIQSAELNVLADTLFILHEDRDQIALKSAAFATYNWEQLSPDGNLPQYTWEFPEIEKNQAMLCALLKFQIDFVLSETHQEVLDKEWLNIGEDLFFRGEQRPAY